MALVETSTICTQLLGCTATSCLPTTTSVQDTQGEISISKSGVGTTLATTTTSLTVNPLAASAEDGLNYASINEINKAELYLESLTDDELANLCETTNILIESKDNDEIKIIKKG